MSGASDVLAPIGRCRVMGVVNVTPDSFSDGGQWFELDRALERGLQLAAEGADLVDVGGESTRPGALRVDADEEARRVVPVVRELAAAGVACSVDTMRAEVAEQALEAGAVLVNDVSGGRADERMTPLVAAARVPFVVMHWRGHSQQMQDLTRYDDVVADVSRELQQQVDDALSAGVDEDLVVIDPGLGFSKTGAQNWSVLAALGRFAGLGYPLLVAASRKRFLGELLADPTPSADATRSADAPPPADATRPAAVTAPADATRSADVTPPAELVEAPRLRPTHEREAATTAISTLSARADAWAVRVHEVRATADAVRVVARIQEEER